MRHHKTVTIKAETLEAAQERARQFALSEQLSDEDTKALVAAAEGETPGRDEGKSYFLTEMDPYTGEKWAMRGLVAMAKMGSSVPTSSRGMAGLAAMGMQAIIELISSDEALREEMMKCVQMNPSQGVYRPLLQGGDDIEEIGTLFKLRQEILELHFDFFKGAGS